MLHITVIFFDRLGETRRPQGQMAQTYLALRALLGLIGILLPILLVLFWLYDEYCLRTSISAYYHSGMRDVFVGSMCAMGIFLFTYTGNNRAESWVANFAGLGAIALALLPTARRCIEAVEGVCGSQDCPTNGPSRVLLDLRDSIGYEVTVSWLHYFGAGVFLVLIAVLCGFFFTTTIDTATKFRRISENSAWWRNVLYIFLSAIIVLCLFMIVLDDLVERLVGIDYDELSAVFWLEALAVWAFGYAWLVKGEVFTLMCFEDLPFKMGECR